MAGIHSAQAPGDGDPDEPPAAQGPLNDWSINERRAGRLLTFTAGAVSGFARAATEGPDGPEDTAGQPPGGLAALPPLNVLAIPEHYPETQGHTWVLPRTLPARAARPPHPARAMGADRYSAWVRQHGGVDLSYTYVRLIAENGWSTPVSITGIRAHVRRLPPLCGTLLWAPPQGRAVPAELGLNLDEPDPCAVEVARTGEDLQARPGESPQHYLSCRPYLPRHTITLAHRETITIVVMAGTARSYCEFSISVTGAVGGYHFYQVVSDNGTPFRVTAPPAGAVPSALTGAGYGAVYDGSNDRNWQHARITGPGTS